MAGDQKSLDSKTSNTLQSDQLKTTKIFVFWSRTDGRVSNDKEYSSHIQYLYQLNQSELDLSPYKKQSLDSKQYYQSIKIGLDGCGKGGLSATIFGLGIKEQARYIVKIINSIILSGKRVELHSIGASRGGIGILYLAKLLGKIPAHLLQQHLILCDPVPGNFINTQQFDFLQTSWASLVTDMRSARNVVSVLNLLPFYPLEDYIAHAPIIPIFSEKTSVSHEVVLGGHMNAFFACHTEFLEFITEALKAKKINRFGRYISAYMSLFTFYRIIDFMRNLNIITEFYPSLEPLNNENSVQSKSWDDFIGFYERNLRLPQVTTKRAVHSMQFQSINSVGKIDLSLRDINPWHSEISERIAPSDQKHQTRESQFVIAEKNNPTTRQAEYLSDAKVQSIRQSLYTMIDPLITTYKHKSPQKHALLIKLKNFLESDQKLTRSQYEVLFRKILLVALQRRKFAWSPFTTTRTGLDVRSDLNKDKYIVLKNLICESNNRLRYRDMRAYVIGGNDKGFFNSTNMDKNLQTLNDNIGIDKPIYPALLRNKR